MKLKKYFFVTVLMLMLFSCSQKDYSEYVDNKNPNKRELIHLFNLLDTYKDYSENRFTVMSEIISFLLKDKNNNRLHLLITTYINDNPEDPYNSYYLLSLASSYLNSGNDTFAVPYLHNAVMLYKDLIIRGESTHFKALEILLKTSNNNNNKIEYYKKLIKEHSLRVEKRDIYLGGVGELYYYLGKILEENQNWEEAIFAFESYLQFDNAVISKVNDAKDEIFRKVGFYHSNKEWVVDNLDQLVANIRYAINVRNPVLLDRYRAFDFFIINWKSNYSELESSFPIESAVLTSMGLKTAKNLDAMSTDTEAYLAVYGNPWSNSIWWVYSTWYFYFKKVDFPMDPNIHGGWEWAGIYLGEKL